MLLPPTNEVWGKVIFLHPFVPLFTGGGLPQCTLGYHPNPPRDHAPPRPCTPPSPGPCTPPTPPAQSMLGDTVNAQAVCIVLECNFVMMAPPLDSTSLYNPLPFTAPPSQQPPPFAPLTFFHIVQKRRRKSKKNFLVDA